MAAQHLDALDALDALREGSPAYSVSAATSGAVMDGGLNRYFNVLPYDHSLLPGAYLNASLIPPLGSHSYVATQAPLPATFQTFYEHIVATGTDTIVNLTPVVERGIRKSDPYWEADALGDGWSVSVDSEAAGDIPGLTVRTLTISAPEHTHQVTQLHFESWPDHGVVPSETLIALANAVQTTRKQDPVWVHCSAGIGRSGTLIGVLLAMEHDDPQVSPVDMAAKITAHMREQRAGMVQTSGH
ncbi:protein-tyrosine-phosphatase [Malassezia cuniculi]|uniref:Protein-tyrosine-phosphatase n=1 Tax=Malassezia cuniculi TaxID=948313 RepID=A0AAF0ETP3_9BASI|nr:protein-tyrosine-phosphatase [Malassezia cuniculi]